MSLFTIKLNQGIYAGAAFCYAGYNECPLQVSNFWDSQGYDGLRIEGKGNRDVHVRPPRGQNAGIIVGRHAGELCFENVVFHAGDVRALLLGADSYHAPNLVPLKVTFRNCTFVEERTTNPGRWGIDSYQTDVVFEECDFWCWNLMEHSGYFRGCADKGWKFVNCRWHESAGECCKIVFRPAARYYPSDHPLHQTGTEDNLHPVSNPSVVLDGGFMQNWGRPGTNVPRGGGLVVQGAAANIGVTNFEFRGTDRGPCIGIDDGGERHFGHKSSIGAARPANGHVGLSSSVLYHNDLMLYVGGDPQDQTKAIVESFSAKECGFFGAGSRIDVQPPADPRWIKCNSPEVVARCRQLGMDVSNPTQVPA